MRRDRLSLLCVCIAAFASALWFAPDLGRASGPTPTPTPFVEPKGCLQPPSDYTRVWVSGVQLNARTVAMLDQAQTIYEVNGGTVVDFRLMLTQGSYNAGGVAASFGTHDGGGAVDIAVRSRVDWSILEDEIEPMVHALRVAGFAAWLRDTGELYPDSPIHIHAIALGDAELSPIAGAQLDGRFGYLRGFDGLPQVDGIPHPDRHGGPVLCAWMIAEGLADMRGLPNPLPTPGGTALPMTPLP